jgi:peptidoglycan/LPS O-acetylase OafA/YrhL
LDVTCRSCGATIAEKAIVCYRCGTPTALPPELAARAKAARPSRRPAWLVAPIILVIIAVAVWLIPQTEPGTPRWVAWAVLVVAVVVTVLLARRR